MILVLHREMGSHVSSCNDEFNILFYGYFLFNQTTKTMPSVILE